jgi:hypothetical protein
MAGQGNPAPCMAETHNSIVQGEPAVEAALKLNGAYRTT